MQNPAQAIKEEYLAQMERGQKRNPHFTYCEDLYAEALAEHTIRHAHMDGWGADNSDTLNGFSISGTKVA